MEVKEIQIITDSASDLPNEHIKKHDIKVIPMQIEIDGINYLDGRDITHEAFYEKMRNSNSLPKTSQPSTGSFLKAYRESLDHNSEVLSIHMSSKLSGTFKGALSAAKELDQRIHVFDSLSGTMGTGLMVLHAAKLKNKGYSVSDIIRELESYRDHVHVIGYLDNLENAVRGGRVKPAKRFFVEWMKIKPITNMVNGNVEVVKALRGKKKTHHYIADEISSYLQNAENHQVYIVHCNAEENAVMLKALISEKIKRSKVHLTTMGPVNSTHVGFGGISACFSPE